MTAQIRDFKKEVLKASELELDHRFRSWVKWVDSVDTSKADGYAFEGDFVKDGTVEVRIGKPRLLLAQATSGSAKYNYQYYCVVRLNADGSLTALDIRTDSTKQGWALRIRDQVKAALDELNGIEIPNPLAQFSDEELLAEIIRRGL